MLSDNVCLNVGAWLDDEGLYICEAKNQFGTIKSEASVSVTGLGRLAHAIFVTSLGRKHSKHSKATDSIKLSLHFFIVCLYTSLLFAEPPVLAQTAPIVTTGIGQSLSLPCMLLDGIPLPQRHWSHNGRPVRLNHSNIFLTRITPEVLCDGFCSCAKVQLNGRMFSRSDGSLHIERATPEDGGTYVCTAVNVAGSMNITITLEVQGRRNGQQFQSFALKSTGEHI